MERGGRRRAKWSEKTNRCAELVKEREGKDGATEGSRLQLGGTTRGPTNPSSTKRGRMSLGETGEEGSKLAKPHQASRG